MEKKIIAFSGIGLSLLTLILLNKKKSIQIDSITLQRIATLHPQLQPFALSLIKKAQSNGIDLRITRAFASKEEQDELYAKGRTEPGQIVTNAKGGDSLHNYGLAFDVVPYVNGKPNYKANWNKIAKIGKSIGLEWGGDFKQLKDLDHFQKSFGYRVPQLANKVNSGDILQSGYVNLSA